MGDPRKAAAARDTDTDTRQLPQDASTEVRVIAGLVFSTLNESWDKFKADNGL